MGNPLASQHEEEAKETHWYLNESRYLVSLVVSPTPAIETDNDEVPARRASSAQLS